MKMDIVFLTGAVDFLGPDTNDRRFVVVRGCDVQRNHANRVTADSLRGLITRRPQGPRPVLLAHHTPPQVGTPRALPLGGNSTPVLAPVAGVWKSERIGERRGQK